MCFNARYLIKTALRRAQRDSPEDVAFFKSMLRQWDEWFRISGFEHPGVVVYTNEKPLTPALFTWGLVPAWAKTKESIWNNTLNAQSETMFEKASFKVSAATKRCLIPADGFYEHHHAGGKTYPFYIQHKEEDKPFYFAGIWNSWNDPLTGETLSSFSIVTTRANPLMAKIHNKPKFADEPRMPVILPEGVADEYLKPLSQKEILELCAPYPEELMKAHTVRPLTGKNSPGNVPASSEKYEYADFDFDGKSGQLKLF